MSVKVVNLRAVKNPTFVCDRSTPLGNPFVMKSFGKKERIRVCKQYSQWFYRNLNPDLSPPGFLEYLDNILTLAKKQDITLGCWCAPNQCHCDTIKKYIELQLDKD